MQSTLFLIPGEEVSPSKEQKETMAVPTHVRHPLAPLTPEEIAAAVSIVRADPTCSEQIRFVMVKLHEPAPEASLFYKPGDVVPPEGVLSLLVTSRCASYVA